MVYNNNKWTWNYKFEMKNYDKMIKPNHRKSGNLGYWETSSNYLVTGSTFQAFFMCQAKA